MHLLFKRGCLASRVLKISVYNHRFYKKIITSCYVADDIIVLEEQLD